MKIQNMKNIIPVVVLLILAVAAHTYCLSQIPFGINVDEIGMGYDAYCLANYGIDRYFCSYPVYLTNYGGGQSALYAYLTMIPIKIKGLNTITLRTVGVIMYTIAIIFGYRTYSLPSGKEHQKGLYYLFLTAILPVWVMLFRIGMDCNLMLAVGTIFFYYLIKASVTGRNRDFMLTGIMGGITLYTYAISYIVMPILIILYLIYMIRLKRLHIKNIIALGIPLSLLAFPLILVQLVNIFDMEAFQLGIFTITKLPVYRAGEINIKNISLVSITTTLKSIFAYDFLRYNSLPEFGTIYYISIPFAVAGLFKSLYTSVKCFMHRTFCKEYLFVCWFLILFLLGCCMVANTNKLNAIFISITYFIIEGIFLVLSCFRNAIRYKKIAAYIITTIYTVFATSFFVYYFGGQYKADYDNMDFFSYSFKKPLAYIMEDETLNQKATYIGYHWQTYAYFLEATMLSPYEFTEIMQTRKYNFSFPDDVNFEANYIVSDTEYNIQNLLEKLGFEKYVFENYTVYSYNMATLQKTEPVKIYWDIGVDEEGYITESAIQNVDGTDVIVLVGWTYNEQNTTLWDDVYIKSGYDIYHAQKVERPDVLKNLNLDKDDLLSSGILFTIPKEALSNKDGSVDLYCIDATNKMQGILQLQLSW